MSQEEQNKKNTLNYKSESISDLSSQFAAQIIVQKYGGATLADPNRIRQVADRISQEAKRGTKMVIVVSAMGTTTNSLIKLAKQVSDVPDQRELDMLLTVGERISMTLLSMALIDRKCPAISFTGSQAGIMTDASHINARIVDIKAHRVQEELSKGKVVILAGFQGVHNVSKEITTLGRGGSDTTAVAMAAFLNADHCEILKDVDCVYSADPNVISTARPLHDLSFDQLLEMTFWGAKVLHYRSVELAKMSGIKLYVGPARREDSVKLHESATQPGVWIQDSIELKKKNTQTKNNTKEVDMPLSKVSTQSFENPKVLAINGHEKILKIQIEKVYKPAIAMKIIIKELDIIQVPIPQILHFEVYQEPIQGISILVTAPSEILETIESKLSNHRDLKIVGPNLCAIAVTCTGATSSEVLSKSLDLLEQSGIQPKLFFVSSLSLIFFFETNQYKKSIHVLHTLTH